MTQQQRTTQTGQERAMKMKAAGFTLLPLPKNMHQISSRGGTLLSGIQKGDPLELYCKDDSEVGSKTQYGGKWEGGYVALSDVMRGKMGGEYDGEDVVWVGEAGQNDPTDPKAQLKGDEWPVDCVRVADDEGQGDNNGDEGGEPSQKAPGAPEKPQEPQKPQARFTSTALFFGPYLSHYDPSQTRGYHGKWVSEGKGRKPVGKGGQSLTAQGVPTARQLDAAHKKMALYGLDEVVLKKNILDVWNTMDQKTQAANILWYYEAHDLSTEWAQHLNCPPEVVAGVIASLSPQVAWGEEAFSVAKFSTSNQAQAYGILQLAFERKNEEVNITPEVAQELNKAFCIDEKGKSKANPNQVDAEGYNGTDPTVAPSTNLLGKHKMSELPADVAVLLNKPNGTMVARGTAALMLARGASPDDLMNAKTGAKILNGPKIRSFYNNIIAPWESQDATIDVHMLGVLGGIENATIHPELLQDDAVYNIFSGVVQDTAHELGILPHELQAAVWSQWSRVLHTDDGEKGRIITAAWREQYPKGRDFKGRPLTDKTREEYKKRLPNG